jgi:ABC-2 type transport system permease protein
MINLLYKEFRLVIHPLWHLMALCGALLLIPNWVYFMALMYFLYIAVPTIFAIAKAQNDVSFSVLLPVRKCDVVKARLVSMSALEIQQIIVAAAFVAMNISLFPKGNLLIDANVAFLGCVFVMYGIFNVIFFPMFYKTAYKIGVPILAALSATFLFAGLVHTLILLIPAVNHLLEGVNRAALVRQVPVLAVGMLLFALLTCLAYWRSAKNFEEVDL